MFDTIIIYVFVKERDAGPLPRSKMDYFVTEVDTLKPTFNSKLSTFNSILNAFLSLLVTLLVVDKVCQID